MHRALHVLVATSVALAPLSASAENKAPDWLFVQTASFFTSDGTTLTMPYEREIFGFTDRPNRLHAYLNAHEFASLWNRGENDFSQSPPNAVLTWVAETGVEEAEVELAHATVAPSGRTISYEVITEAGETLPDTATNISLFIDNAAGDVLLDAVNDSCEEAFMMKDGALLRSAGTLGASTLGSFAGCAGIFSVGAIGAAFGLFGRY